MARIAARRSASERELSRRARRGAFTRSSWPSSVRRLSNSASGVMFAVSSRPPRRGRRRFGHRARGSGRPRHHFSPVARVPVSNPLRSPPPSPVAAGVRAGAAAALVARPAAPVALAITFPRWRGSRLPCRSDPWRERGRRRQEQSETTPTGVAGAAPRAAAPAPRRPTRRGAGAFIAEQLRCRRR